MRDPAGRPSCPDLVHRPFQIATPGDLPALAELADRLVITHQDLISFHNPSYFRSADAWHSYRDLTRRGLAIADHVVFFSKHARHEALAEELIDVDRSSVVYHGVDHSVTGAGAAAASRPAAASILPDGAEVMLCIGTDFRHKNRLFALEMLEQLRHRHDWRGWLVLAGPHVDPGSSRPDERGRLEATPGLANVVLDLGPVSEPEKEWLLQRADLVLYPTVHEGFGLVPFEAADHDVACAWAPGTSLGEVLPESEAAIVPWDAGASAQRALELMREPAIAQRQVQAIREASAAMSWNSTAAQLLEVYRAVCDRPAAPAGILERERGVMRAGLSEDAVRLVGPGGALPRELERPLLALATHPRLGTPVLGAIKAGYRVSSRWRDGTIDGRPSDAPVPDGQGDA